MKIKALTLGNLEANCFYVNVGDSAVIIDVGDYTPELEDFISFQDVKPSAILLTHGHIDHIAGAVPLAEEMNIPIYIGAEDKEMLYSKMKSLGMFIGGYHQKKPVNSTEIITLSGGESLKIGDTEISVLPLSGHTKGGVGYLIGENLFCGDTVFCGSAGRTDFPGGNIAELKKAINKIKELPESITLYCGHGPQTTVKAEKMNNPYFNF